MEMAHNMQHSRDNNHLEDIFGDTIQNAVTTLKLYHVHRQMEIRGKKKTVSSAYRYPSSHKGNSFHDNGCKVKIHKSKLIFPPLYM
jgi:hypothetical protein